MDDFINKVAWGLNLVFSNGVGYPRTRLADQARRAHEQKFKYFLRRHQLPTQVWYKAYPGLTAGRPRAQPAHPRGPGAATMTDAQALEWLRLL